MTYHSILHSACFCNVKNKSKCNLRPKLLILMLKFLIFGQVSNVLEETVSFILVVHIYFFASDSFEHLKCLLCNGV